MPTDGADLAAIRESLEKQHQERLKALKDGDTYLPSGRCLTDGQRWPCQTARLLAHAARLGEALEAATRKAADRVFDYLNGDSWGVQDYAPEQFAHHDGREEKPTRETVETALQMGFERGLMKARDLLLRAALKASE